MGNLMYTLETAKRTLLNTQVSIQTTSHNIANADNPNYARQKAIVQTSGAYRARPGWIGMGAGAERVIQLRDQFIEGRLHESGSRMAHYDALASQLRTLGNHLLDDGAAGLSQVLGNFWNSWEALQKNPMGLAERENVNQAAQRMADALNTTSMDLERLLRGVDAEVQMLAGSSEKDKGVVEGLLSKMAVLNRQIRLAETPAHPANDLRDQRYQVLQELSAYLPIEHTEEKNSFVTVRLSTREGSLVLVDGETHAHLKYEDGQVQVMAPKSPWVPVDLNLVVGGSLSGLLEARGAIEGVRTRLDAFAENFAHEVNELLPEDDPIFSRQEETLEWSVSSEFWSHFDSSPIQDLGELASRMVALSDAKHVDLENASFSHYLGDLQRHLGTMQRDAEVKGEFYRTLKSELKGQQQFVSGVNLDEEMVDILRNQQVYQAAAKIIQRTDELLRTVINMV